MFQVGTDIVSVKRMQESIEKQGDAFIERVFTAREKDYCGKKRAAYESYAARFAAKEAFIKAVGGTHGAITYADIEIINDASGVPSLVIPDAFLKKYRIRMMSVSLAHERDFATATVLVEFSAENRE